MGEVDVRGATVPQDAGEDRGVGFGVGREDEDVPRAQLGVGGERLQQFVAQHLGLTDDAVAPMDRDGFLRRVLRGAETAIPFIEPGDALLEGAKQGRGERLFRAGFPAEVPLLVVDQLGELVAEMLGRLADEVGPGGVKVVRQLGTLLDVEVIA